MERLMKTLALRCAEALLDIALARAGFYHERWAAARRAAHGR